MSEWRALTARWTRAAQAPRGLTFYMRTALYEWAFEGMTRMALKGYHWP